MPASIAAAGLVGSASANLRFCQPQIVGKSEVAMGKVKWFNAMKGYGFIQPDDGGPDVFVHIRAVEKAGYGGLVEGARINYEVVTGRAGKMSAENLKLG
jgi:cold shock protein